MADKNKSVVIRFLSFIDANSINQLLATVDRQLQAGVEQIRLLISCPGGTVTHGLSAYNYLRGIPAEVITHNFGSVDSIGVILYCAGDYRYSVPHARFLLHSVAANFMRNDRLNLKQVEERLKSLQIDTLNMAKVIAANTGQQVETVSGAMHEGITLNPDEAVEWGLVHEIRSELFEPGSKVIAITGGKSPIGLARPPLPPRPTGRPGQQ
jgi:ATP-dependent Clp protease protease subunit